MLLLRSVRSRLLLDHRAIAHSLQRCSKYEKIIVERLRRSENGNFITRKRMFHFALTLIFGRPFSLVSRSPVFAKLFKLEACSILRVNLNLNLSMWRSNNKSKRNSPKFLILILIPHPQYLWSRIFNLPNFASHFVPLPIIRQIFIAFRNISKV